MEAIAVGLALVESGKGVEHRHQKHGERGRDQHQQREAGEVGQRVEPARAVDGVVEDFVGQPESGERDGRLHRDTFQDVAVYVVAQFVSENRFNFIGRVVLEKRVRQNDAACGAQSR